MFSDQPVAAGVSPANSRPMAEGPKARSAANDKSMTHLTTGTVSPLQEDETRYYATAMVNKSAGHLKLATVSWLKEPLESWRARVEKQAATALTPPGDSYKLPPMSQGDGCVEDTWTATAGPPDARASYTAVWTGSEMIVWGGLGPIPLNTGGRYNPSTDSWVATTTTNAPAVRSYHTAVWTGNEMIVWGGLNDDNLLNSGGRYNRITDSWIPTTITNAPDARYLHTAVWTGNEMIVWGGLNDNLLNSGGRYNPRTDNWVATTTTNGPGARSGHTAEWTGTEMIVWGAQDGEPQFHALDTGGKYGPATDTWTATSTTDAPDGRAVHTAAWTGSEMIVWGGIDENLLVLNTGGKYNPTSDSWTPTTTVNAPAARYQHTALWTGNEMISWGGGDEARNFFDTGGRYDPDTDTWTATSTTNVPESRTNHTAVWIGSEMIVWGGARSTNGIDITYLDTGGKYNPATDSWTATSTNNAPGARFGHTAIWTDREMIVWGGDPGFFVSGGRYCAQGGPTPTPRATPRPRPTPHPRPTPP